jgi:hypothetical protein
MHTKIVSVGVFLCFLFLTIPAEYNAAQNTIETDIVTDEIADISLFALVVAKGTGNVTTIGGNFLLGIGYCLAMVVELEDDGQVEITSLFDPSNSSVVEGRQRILLIGFVGIRFTLLEVNINGLVLFTSPI